jgi:hypothetical protein
MSDAIPPSTRKDLSIDDQIKMQIAINDVMESAVGLGNIIREYIWWDYANFITDTGARFRISNWRNIDLEADCYQVQYSILDPGSSKAKFKPILPAPAEKDPADWWKTNES